MDFFKKRWTILLFAMLCVAFLVIYSSFVCYTTLSGNKELNQYIYNWPDEMANNFFTAKFIATGILIQAEPFNLAAGNVIHPRSVNVIAGNLVPMGFLGLEIIYGFIGKIIGQLGINFLTPLFGVLGVLAFYGIIKQVFSKKLGWISAILLFTMASYWYYSSLVMLPTILFISLLLIGLYFYCKQGSVNKKQALSYSILAGLFIGLALMTRLIEFMWVGIILLIPFIFYIKKIRWFQICLFLIAVTLPIGLMLFYNQQTYGNAWAVGYLRFQQQGNLLEKLPTEFAVQSDSAVISYLKLIFIPFGFHPKLILFNLYKYFGRFLWPYVLFFVAGGILWLSNYCKKLVDKKEKVFVSTGLCVSTWLIIYYGSWLFVDKWVLAQNTISSSYVRYWLPINILILPLIAYLIVQLEKLNWSKRIVVAVQILLIASLIMFSVKLVYKTPGDGLIAQKQTIENYYNQSLTVSNLITDNAIIIVDRADKLFFPKYKVVVFNEDDSIFSRLSNIPQEIPIYYFTNRADEAIQGLNKELLKPLNLTLINPQTIDQAFRLFWLEKF